MNINATLFVQAISFAALIWFTVKFVWPLITDAIDARNQKIAEGLAAGEQGRQDLAKAKERTDAMLRETRQQVQEMMAHAERRAAEIVAEAKDAAKVEGDRIVAGAKAEIEQEASRAREELRQQTASLALAVAEKILRREVDAKAHAELLASLKQQL